MLDLDPEPEACRDPCVKQIHCRKESRAYYLGAGHLRSAVQAVPQTGTRVS